MHPGNSLVIGQERSLAGNQHCADGEIKEELFSTEIIKCKTIGREGCDEEPEYTGGDRDHNGVPALPQNIGGSKNRQIIFQANAPGDEPRIHAEDIGIWHERRAERIDNRKSNQKAN